MESYALKWNNHNATMINALTGLLGSGTLTDVTLAADGQVMAAHSVILCACSPYFETQLKAAGISGKHPVIVLHDVRYQELKAIVEFMYSGEVSVAEEDLPRLLAIGDNLRIKGLAEKASDDTLINAPPKGDEPIAKKRKFDDEEEAANLTVERKVEPKEEPVEEESFGNESCDDEDSYDDSRDLTNNAINSLPQNFSADFRRLMDTRLKDSGFLNSGAPQMPQLNPSSGIPGGHPFLNFSASSSASAALVPPVKEKRFPCPQCGRAYAAMTSVNRHLRWECGLEPQFACDICQRKFYHKHTLTHHLRGAHEIFSAPQPVALVGKSNNRSPPPIDDGAKN